MFSIKGIFVAILRDTTFADHWWWAFCQEKEISLLAICLGRYSLCAVCFFR